MEGDAITLVGSDKVELIVGRTRAVAASGTIRCMLEDPLLTFDSASRIELSDISSLTLRNVVRVIDGTDPLKIFEDTRRLSGVIAGIQFILALNYLDMDVLKSPGIWNALRDVLVHQFNLLHFSTDFKEITKHFGLPECTDSGLLQLREAVNNPPKRCKLFPCEEYEVGYDTNTGTASLAGIPKDLWIRHLLPALSYSNRTMVLSALLHPTIYHMVVDWLHNHLFDFTPFYYRKKIQDKRIAFSIFFNDMLQNPKGGTSSYYYTKSEAMRSFALTYSNIRFHETKHNSGIFKVMDIIAIAYREHKTVARLESVLARRSLSAEARVETKKRKHAEEEARQAAWKPLFLKWGFTEAGFEYSMKNDMLPHLEMSEIESTNKKAKAAVDEGMNDMAKLIKVDRFDDVNKFVTRPTFKKLVAKFA